MIWACVLDMIYDFVLPWTGRGSGTKLVVMIGWLFLLLAHAPGCDCRFKFFYTLLSSCAKYRTWNLKIFYISTDLNFCCECTDTASGVKHSFTLCHRPHTVHTRFPFPISVYDAAHCQVLSARCRILDVSAFLYCLTSMSEIDLNYACWLFSRERFDRRSGKEVLAQKQCLAFLFIMSSYIEEMWHRRRRTSFVTCWWTGALKASDPERRSGGCISGGIGLLTGRPVIETDMQLARSSCCASLVLDGCD